MCFSAHAKFRWETSCYTIAIKLLDTYSVRAVVQALAVAQTFGAPTFDGLAFEGPSCEGSSFEGPGLEGHAFAGPAFEVPTFEGPAFEGPSL